MLNGLNHVTLAVSDIDRSFGFYVELLGFVPQAKWRHGAYLSLHGLWLCLSLDQAEPARDYTHLAFSVDEGVIADWSEKLSGSGAVFWKKNTSEGESVYFLDPDGHKLELHSGDLRSRLESIRREPYEELELF